MLRGIAESEPVRGIRRELPLHVGGSLAVAVGALAIGTGAIATAIDCRNGMNVSCGMGVASLALGAVAWDAAGANVDAAGAAVGLGNLYATYVAPRPVVPGGGGSARGRLWYF